MERANNIGSRYRNRYCNAQYPLSSMCVTTPKWLTGDLCSMVFVVCTLFVTILTSIDTNSIGIGVSNF